MPKDNNHLDRSSILKSVWSLSWPMVSTYFLQTLVSLVDIKMVGMLGPDNIAAVGLATAVLMVVLMLMMGLGTGTTALVARYTGEGSPDRVRSIVMQSYLISLGVAALITVLGALTSTFAIRAAGGSGEVLTLGASYLHILSLGGVFLTGNMVISAILVGMGKTKTNLQILSGINVLHIVGNYCLIFGVGPFPELGVKGAALSAIISRGVGVVLGYKAISALGYGHKSWREVFKLQAEYAKKIIQIGFPVAFEAVNRRLQITVINKILSYTAYGTKAISAYTIGLQAEAISFMPGLAFSVAATSLVGNNLGAGRKDRAEESVWVSVRFAALLMSVMGMFLVLFSEDLIRFFTPDENVVKIGSHYLIVNGIAQPLMALNMVLSGALRGAGDSVSPFWIAVSTLWGLRVPVAIILSLTLGLGADGVWYAMLLSIVASCVLLYRKFKQGEWKKISP